MLKTVMTALKVTQVLLESSKDRVDCYESESADL